jgi:hypothetical protein
MAIFNKSAKNFRLPILEGFFAFVLMEICFVFRLKRDFNADMRPYLA